MEGILVNRAARRKELQRLNRAERRRKRELSRRIHHIERNISDDYMTKEAALDFLTKLYRKER